MRIGDRVVRPRRQAVLAAVPAPGVAGAALARRGSRSRSLAMTLTHGIGGRAPSAPADGSRTRGRRRRSRRSRCRSETAPRSAGGGRARAAAPWRSADRSARTRRRVVDGAWERLERAHPRDGCRSRGSDGSSPRRASRAGRRTARRQRPDRSARAPPVGLRASARSRAAASAMHDDGAAPSRRRPSRSRAGAARARAAPRLGAQRGMSVQDGARQLLERFRASSSAMPSRASSARSALARRREHGLELRRASRGGARSASAARASTRGPSARTSSASSPAGELDASAAARRRDPGRCPSCRESARAGERERAREGPAATEEAHAVSLELELARRRRARARATRVRSPLAARAAAREERLRRRIVLRLDEELRERRMRRVRGRGRAGRPRRSVVTSSVRRRAERFGAEAAHLDVRRRARPRLETSRSMPSSIARERRACPGGSARVASARPPTGWSRSSQSAPLSRSRR